MFSNTKALLTNRHKMTIPEMMLWCQPRSSLVELANSYFVLNIKNRRFGNYQTNTPKSATRRLASTKLIAGAVRLASVRLARRGLLARISEATRFLTSHASSDSSAIGQCSCDCKSSTALRRSKSSERMASPSLFTSMESSDSGGRGVGAATLPAMVASSGGRGSPRQFRVCKSGYRR